MGVHQNEVKSPLGQCLFCSSQKICLKKLEEVPETIFRRV
jgi:hypothetical protein